MECPACGKFYFSGLQEGDEIYHLQCTKCGWHYNYEQTVNPELIMPKWLPEAFFQRNNWIFEKNKPAEYYQYAGGFFLKDTSILQISVFIISCNN